VNDKEMMKVNVSDVYLSCAKVYDEMKMRRVHMMLAWRLQRGTTR